MQVDIVCYGLEQAPGRLTRLTGVTDRFLRASAEGTWTEMISI